MAEDTAMQQAGEQTQEQTTEKVESQEQGLDEGYLQELVAKVLDSRLAGVHQRLESIDALQARLEELGTSTQKLDKLMRQMAKGVMTEESQEIFLEALSREEADLDAKQAKTRAEKAEAEVKSLAQGSWETAKSVAWEHVLAQIADTGEAEGITDRETLIGLMPKEAKPTSADRFGYITVQREWTKAIKAEADKREKAKETKPTVVTERGGGATSEDTAYRAWLKGEGPRPSPEVIDRLTAKKFAAA